MLAAWRPIGYASVQPHHFFPCQPVGCAVGAIANAWFNPRIQGMIAERCPSARNAGSTPSAIYILVLVMRYPQVRRLWFNRLFRASEQPTKRGSACEAMPFVY